MSCASLDLLRGVVKLMQDLEREAGKNSLFNLESWQMITSITLEENNMNKPLTLCVKLLEIVMVLLV